MNDDAYAACAHWRDEQMALLLTVVIGLAARRYPEEVRKALAEAFDLSAVEEMSRRVMGVASEAQAAAQEARALVYELHRELDDVEKRIDQLHFALEGKNRWPSRP